MEGEEAQSSESEGQTGSSSRLPSFGAELDAMFREAVKDIRQTFNEVMMGTGEHAPEAGTPMNPTQIEVTKDRGVSEMSPDQGGVHGPASTNQENSGSVYGSPAGWEEAGGGAYSHDEWAAMSPDQGGIYGSADMAAYQAQLDGITSHGRQEQTQELEM